MDDVPTGPAHHGAIERGAFAPFQFGKYEIVEELGRGGMGVVYRAHQADLDRTVAIKMILAHHVAVQGFADRFHGEAKAAAKVNHPNIVGVYETGVIHNQHFIAMEFVAGRSLAQLFERGEVDLLRAVRIIAEISRAVHFMHVHDILHRDLKPSNIMVTAEGRPVLTDFGLALVRGSEKGDGTGITGTPGYVAPEIVRDGTAGTTERSDVYSLGATLYRAATGRTPFDRRSSVEAFLHVLDRDPELPRALNPKIPLALQTIILMCLERDPARRYATAEDLAIDLEQFLIGEPIRATPPHGLVRVRRWVRGYPALALRWLGYLLFSLITIFNTYAIGVVSPQFCAAVLICLGVGAGASLVCSLLETKHRHLARVLWACIDAIVLTMVLRIADGVASPLLLAYPLWVAMSGFWNHVALVVLTTGLALASYGSLAVDAVWNRPDLIVGPDRHLVFVCIVILTGIVVGMQTRRARAISRFLARR